MNLELLGLFFDFVMLLLLIATITYSARLSLSLKKFRENRDVLDKMIGELNKNVQDAHHVIQDLQDAAKRSGGELQSVVDQAVVLSDELSLMNEAGNNLADRLGNLADRNSVDGYQYEAAPVAKAPKKPSKTGNKSTSSAKSNAKNKSSKSGGVSSAQAEKDAESFLDRVFAIRDPDVERGDNPLDNVMPLSDDDLHSEAEKDLLRALKQKDN
jgi:hypothetical protein